MAAVGLHCPECIREAQVVRATADRQHRAQNRQVHGGTVRRGVRRWLAMPSPVTIGIIAATALVGVLQVLTPWTTQLLAFQTELAITQPWRLVTLALVHGSLLHFLFNMFTLYLIGPAIERRIGGPAFLVTYLLLAIAGCAAVALISPGSAVVGASGAIFGLFGAYIGLQRMIGGRFDTQVLVVVGVNLLIGLFLQGVSWEAHVGGLSAGLAFGFGLGALERRRTITQGAATWTAVGALGAVVVVGWVASILL